MLLKTPGIGPKSADLIVASRRHSRLNSEHLKKMGVVLKRAQYFITCNELEAFRSARNLKPEFVRQLMLSGQKMTDAVQLHLFQSAEILYPSIQ